MSDKLPQNPSPLLVTASEAAQAAMEQLRWFDENRTKWSIDLKAKNDLVTQADRAAEEHIIAVIRRDWPDDHILAEESASEAGLGPGRTWIVDPLDGTTNFAHGVPMYAISIGVWENRQPIAALVVEVNRQEWYSAEAGKGAWLDGRPMHISQVREPSEALLATGFPYRDLGLVDHYLKLFKAFMHETQGVRRPGSAAFDMALVAAGRCDGFFEYGLAPWDVGAGALLIREAGGVVTDWTGSDGWLFGQRIVAGNATMHGYILRRIEELVPENYRKVVAAG